MTSVNIRPAVSEDGAILARLNALVHEIHVARRPDYFRPTAASEVAEWFRSMLAKASVRAWIAESGATPLGYALAVVHERPPNPFCHARRWCEIDQIAVAPGARRQGVARALVERVILEARAQRIGDVEAVAWSFNEDAHVAFRQLGLVPKTLRYEWTGGP